MATDSPWAYQTLTLDTPENVHDSTWAYTYVTLADPDGADSTWAYAIVTIHPPHEPAGVLTTGAIRYVRVNTGGEL